MQNWVIPAGIAAVAGIFLFSANAEASVQSGSNTGSGSGSGSTPLPTGTTVGAIVPGGPLLSAYSAAQQRFIVQIMTEAKRQGVPVELALATAEVESTFSNAVNEKGASYGPMQVNVKHLKPGETTSDLMNPAFSIALGVSILKRYMAKAGGNTVTTRLYYFCGPAYTDATCKPATRDIVTARWAKAVAKWKVKSYYVV